LMLGENEPKLWVSINAFDFLTLMFAIL